MQHVIELDQQTEQNLNTYVVSSGKTEKDILAIAVKDYLQQHIKRKSLEQKLKPYQINLDGFSLDREMANER